MSSKDKAVVITKKLRRFFGHFPQVDENMARIEDLLQYRCAVEEPEHIMLIGDPGTGKSTMLRCVVRKHPRIQHDEFVEAPVLYTPVPSNCTIKRLAGAMLFALGAPHWDKGDAEEREFQLHTLIPTMRVRLIVLDEINHVVDRGRAKTHESVADWIKQFSDRANVSMVLAGIRRSRQLVSANDQFADRFREVLELEPLSVADDDRRDEFFAVMEAFETVLDGVRHIDLKTDAMLTKLAFATGGRLRNIRRLLVRSVELASAERGFSITEDTIERAFLQVIFKGACVEQNPFSSKFRGTPLTRPGEPYAPNVREVEVA